MNDDLDHIIEGMLRHAKYLPAGQKYPLELLVLRGHLLIEEQLQELVAAKFLNKKAFDINSAKYSTVLRLAHALYDDALKPWEWEVVHQINVVRNSLAHSLRDDTLDNRIQKKIFAVFQREDPTFAYAKDNLMEKLNYCLSYIHTQLLRLRHGG